MTLIKPLVTPLGHPNPQPTCTPRFHIPSYTVGPLDLSYSDPIECHKLLLQKNVHSEFASGPHQECRNQVRNQIAGGRCDACSVCAANASHTSVVAMPFRPSISIILRAFASLAVARRTAATRRYRWQTPMADIKLLVSPDRVSDVHLDKCPPFGLWRLRLVDAATKRSQCVFKATARCGSHLPQMTCGLSAA